MFKEVLYLTGNNVDVCCVAVDSSRGTSSTEHSAADSQYPPCPTVLHHSSTSPHLPDDPSLQSDRLEVTSTGHTEGPTDRQTDGEVGGRQSKAGGSGRRKAGSARLGFQYPDVFGRRRSRGGGAMAAAGRRRAMTSGGTINFRRQSAQALPDDVTSGGDAGNKLEVSLNIFRPAAL